VSGKVDGKIIIVEDWEDIRWSYAEHFRAHKWEAHEAADVKTAEELLSRFRFDVALVDRRLPVGVSPDAPHPARAYEPEAGDYLAEEILSRAPSTCVIILTAWPDITSAAAWGRLGVFRYIAKDESVTPPVVMQLAKSGVAWARVRSRRKELFSKRNEDEMLDFVVKTGQMCFAPDACCVALSSGAAAGNLTIKKMSVGPPIQFPEVGAPLSRSRPFVAKVLDEDGPVLSRTRQETEGLAPLLEDAASLMAVRVPGVAGALGILSVESRTSDAFDTPDLETLEDLAGLIGEGYLLTSYAQAQIQGALLQAQVGAEELAHRLRNPLQVVQIEAEFLCTKELKRMPETASDIRTAMQRRVERIQKQIVEALNSVTSFMDILHPKSCTLRPVLLGDILTRALEQKLGAFEQAEVDPPVSQGDEPRVYVKASAEDCVYMLGCLLDNACRAVRLKREDRSRRDGELGAPDDWQPSVQVQVVLAWDGKEVEVRVSDNGIGIPAEDRPKIFTLYFVGERMKGEGKGVGLFHSQQIALAHHGWIRWTSQEGVGTTFTLVLPTCGAEDATEDVSLF
jgi:signal transduction histidine kinase/ActR/RegA family two-component response regulator